MLLANIQHLLLLYTAYVIAVASPGRSAMAIMGVAMNQGRAAAVALALGVVTGSMFWAVLAATGISTVLTAYAEAIFAIKIAGGLYLLYLAYKSAKSALSINTGQTKTAPFAKTAALIAEASCFIYLTPRPFSGGSR